MNNDAQGRNHADRSIKQDEEKSKKKLVKLKSANDSQSTKQSAQPGKGQRKTGSKPGFQGIQSLFNEYEVKQDSGYITREFQDYGYRLAVDLDDLKHKSLYIKLAKQENRGLLERARSFVIDSEAKNKGALFMWKLKQLKDNRDKNSEDKDGSSGEAEAKAEDDGSGVDDGGNKPNKSDSTINDT